MRIIKPVEIDPEDGEILGTYVWDVQKPRMHGSRPQWEGRLAQGNMRRMSERPGQHQPRRSR